MLIHMIHIQIQYVINNNAILAETYIFLCPFLLSVDKMSKLKEFQEGFYLE